MSTAVYWLNHAVVGLLGIVLWGAISFRATVTVFYVLAIELIWLVGMTLPGAANVFFTLELFGGFGLILGIPLSFGRGALRWWTLPTLAAAMLIVLQVTLLFGADWRTIRVGGLLMLIAAVALAGGMLCGRGLVALCALGLSRMKRKLSRPERGPSRHL